MIAKRLLTWGIHGVPVATVGLLASWYVWYAAAARLDLSPWLALAGTVSTVVVVAIGRRSRLSSKPSEETLLPRESVVDPVTTTAWRGPGTAGHESLVFTVTAVAIAGAVLLGLPLLWTAVAVAVFCIIVIARTVAALSHGLATRPVTALSSVEVVTIWVCAGVIGLLAALVNRPDLDDAFFGAVVANVTATAHLGASDHAYGAMRVMPIHDPLLNPWEQLVASISIVSGLDSAIVYWIVIPPVLALVSLLGTAFAAHQVGLRRLEFGIPLVVLFLIFDGAVHAGFGNLHFARMWQGKIILVAVVIPIIFALACRAMREPGRWNYALVIVAFVAALSTTDSAIMLMPFLAAVVVVALATVRFGTRVLVVAAPIAALGVVVIMLAGRFSARGASISMVDGLTYVMGGRTHTALYVAVICLGLIVAHHAGVRMFLAGATLMGFLCAGPLRPGLVAIYPGSDPIIWRFLWLVPILILVAGLATRRYGLPIAGPSPRVAAVVAPLAIVIVAAGSLVWSPTNNARIGSPTSWKLPEYDAEAVTAIRNATALGDMVLAPISVMDALASSTRDVDVVSGRYAGGLVEPEYVTVARSALASTIESGAPIAVTSNPSLDAVGVDIVCARTPEQLRSARALVVAGPTVWCARVALVPDPA